MQLRLIDTPAANPAEHLALDEALLESVEKEGAPDTLRIWESESPFVVLGTAQKVKEEVDEAACESNGVPILRRCSAGGCVLQGPGSLNFALILRYNGRKELSVLHDSYCFILKRLSAAFADQGINACHQGISDMAMDGYKISGNAQRRKRNTFLHHGTLLYELQGDLMQQCLREPADRPEYRGDRAHHDFVRPIPLDRAALRAAVLKAFDCEDTPQSLTPFETTCMQDLATTKYTDPAWTYRR